jgi:predicted ATP-binding protein involved in virulence
MKLKRLTLKNFRCFDELEIDFHDQLTVLIAPNGAGKTTVLDAARIALSSFIKGIDVSSARPHVLASITPDDVRLQKMPSGSMEPQKPSRITADGIFCTHEPDIITWYTERRSVEPKTRMFRDDIYDSITSVATELQKKAQDEQTSDSTALPLILYQGTGRLWYQGRFTATIDDKKLEQQMYSRIWGYENCLTATSGYKQFEDWYGWLFKSYRELQIANMESPNNHNGRDLDVFKQSVESVQKAVNEVTEAVTGWKNLQYRQSQGQKLVMEHDKLGFMPLDMLSDGLRNIVILVADIAFRCVRLNPYLGKHAALETTGVVLIDEVDMFLHPEWQQQVMGSLQRAFPKLQFIVTTHSPQVLTTVLRESIRKIVIADNGQARAETPLMNSYGMESQNALQGIMEVDPQPPVAEKADLDELTTLIESGQYQRPKAQQLMEKLMEQLGHQHPQILRLQRSIRRMKALKR